MVGSSGASLLTDAEGEARCNVTVRLPCRSIVPNECRFVALAGRDSQYSSAQSRTCGIGIFGLLGRLGGTPCPSMRVGSWILSQALHEAAASRSTWDSEEGLRVLKERALNARRRRQVSPTCLSRDSFEWAHAGLKANRRRPILNNRTRLKLVRVRCTALEESGEKDLQPQLRCHEVRWLWERRYK